MVEAIAVHRDTPLRLARAVELAFPEGGMTISGFRREIARGRLEVERIAGKDFVTLAGIDLMRERCRMVAIPQAPAAITSQTRRYCPADGSVALAAALRTAEALRKPKELMVSRP